MSLHHDDVLWHARGSARACRQGGRYTVGMMTRSQVAKRLGKSIATVRRMEGHELHPTKDERGFNRFDPSEVEAVARGGRSPVREAKPHRTAELDQFHDGSDDDDGWLHRWRAEREARAQRHEQERKEAEERREQARLEEEREAEEQVRADIREAACELVDSLSWWQIAWLSDEDIEELNAMLDA